MHTTILFLACSGFLVWLLAVAFCVSESARRYLTMRSKACQHKIKSVTERFVQCKTVDELALMLRDETLCHERIIADAVLNNIIMATAEQRELEQALDRYMWPNSAKRTMQIIRETIHEQEDEE